MKLTNHYSTVKEVEDLIKERIFEYEKRIRDVNESKQEYASAIQRKRKSFMLWILVFPVMTLILAAYIIFASFSHGIFNPNIDTETYVSNYLQVFLNAFIVALFAIPIGGYLFFYFSRLFNKLRDEIEQYKSTSHSEIQSIMCEIFGMRQSETLISQTLKDKKVTLVNLLEESQLITGRKDDLVVDNIFSAQYNSKTLTVCEMFLPEVKSGINPEGVLPCFFIMCTLEKTLSGNTFITKENDIFGFANGGATNPKYQTELEWNAFEKLLRVTTNDQVEARYVLQTDFLSRLYDWWKDENEQRRVRISFIGDKMFILFPNPTQKIQNFTEMNKDSLQEYLSDIGKSLYYTLCLIDEIPA